MRLPPCLLPPTGLLTLQDAQEGGLSNWASSVAVHNAMLRRGRKVSDGVCVTVWLRVCVAASVCGSMCGVRGLMNARAAA